MTERHTITVLLGDGIGPEVVRATLRVLDKLDLGLTYEIFPFGEATEGKIPEEVIGSFERNKGGFKGPTATPSGGGYGSLNVRLRQQFDLYANVRPFFSLPNVTTRYSSTPINFVVVRENSEGEYDVRETRTTTGVDVSYRMTSNGCDRIAEFAFAYAERMGFTKLCVGHKANIIKFSNGMFRDAAYEAARRHPSVACQNLIVDNYGMQLLRDPSQFQVMLFTNLMGDIFSDLCAGIVHGSLGFAGSANIGHTHFIGEAVHGTAPDIVGHGVANPAAMMFSAALMLDHMGMTGSANRLRAAITKTLQDGIVTKDVNRATGVGTEAWTDAVVTRL